MMEREYPLQWPQGLERTPDRSRAPGRFQRTLAQARAALIKEVQAAGGSNVLLSSNYGGLSGKSPADPGVAVYFNRRGKRLGLACDRWSSVEHNLAALANTVEAIRGIERWGCGQIMEQAFAAFEALPPPPPPPGPLPPSGHLVAAVNDWRTVLGFGPASVRVDQVRARFRHLSKTHHPDAGGDVEEFNRLSKALEQALKELA